MPNANVVNRLKHQVKPNTMVKVEKENENSDIRRRTRSNNKDKAQSTKQETVWERLSKVRKSASNDSGLASTAKNVARTKSSARLPLLQNSTNQTQKKPLSAPNPSTTPRRCMEKKHQQQQQQLQKKHKSKLLNDLLMLPPPLPTSHSRSVLGEIPLCKPVKEILTVRTINNSKSSSDESKESSEKSQSSPPPLFRRATSLDCGAEKYHIKELKQPRLMDSSSFSQASVDDFDLLSRRRYYYPEDKSLNSSAKIQNNFERLLRQKQKTMAPGDIRLIKNVVKSDDRYRQLRRSDEKLFKDILKTQLREILKQGTVVKSALNHLDGKDNESIVTLPTVSENPSSSTDVQQVDVIFKNVPTLEKEIIILRALGEKLEATLKRTVGPTNSAPRQSAVSPNSRRRSAHLMYDATRMGKIMHRVVGIQCMASVHVRSKGSLRTLGFVREFYIAHKTIVELKKEADRHFYLPLNGPNMGLTRTNYKKLKQNPDILMQHLKPKNPDVAFNVLEQDPIFFHSFVHHRAHSPTNAKDISQSVKISTARNSSEEEKEPATIVNLCEGGDSRKLLHDIDTNEMKPKATDTRLPTTEDAKFSKINKTKNRKHSDRSIVADEKLKPDLSSSGEAAHKLKSQMIVVDPSRNRRRIRRTPMPIDKYVTPKNNLIKTILVGGLQLSCFLLLIMALTYPEFKC